MLQSRALKFAAKFNPFLKAGVTCASHTALKHRATRRKAQRALEGVLSPIRGFSITSTAVYGREMTRDPSFPQLSTRGTITPWGSGDCH